jgi:VWFA-related protein
MAGVLLVGALAWVSLLHLISGGTGPAESEPAEDGSRASIKFVDKSQFNENGLGQISLRMDIVDAQGKPILGLRKEQFQVTEEGHPADVVALQGPGTQPINVVLVIDISGSMGDEDKMAGAIQAALAAVDELQAGRDRLGIIAFDDSFDLVQPLEILDDANRSLRQQKIRALRPRGGTVIGVPTLEAVSIFERQAPDGPKMVMVMTDGQDKSLAGIVDMIADQSDKSGVPVFTIGFGRDAMGAEAVLRDLAQKCKAAFYHAPTAQELAAIYRSQVQEMTNEFTVVYHSPYPTADGLPRRVDVQISAAAGTLAARANYSIGGIVDSGGVRAVPKTPTSSAVKATAASAFLKLFLFVTLFVLLSGALIAPNWRGARPWAVGPGVASSVSAQQAPVLPASTAAPQSARPRPPRPPPPPAKKQPLPATSPQNATSPGPATPPSSPAPSPAVPSSTLASKPAPVPGSASPLSSPPGEKKTIRPVPPPPPPPPGRQA